METPISNLAVLLKTMEPVLNDGVYVYAVVPNGMPAPAVDAIATFRESEGLTIVAPETLAREAKLEVLFRAAWITLKVHSALEAVGLTAAFSRALGEAGISCNVMAAACHDHIFVPLEKAQQAVDCLRRLQQHAAAQGMGAVMSPPTDSAPAGKPPAAVPQDQAAVAPGPHAPQLRIVRLDATHAAAYRSLMLHAYAAAPDAFTATPEERAGVPLSWWLQRLADPQGLSVVFGAFHEGELVGSVTLEFSQRPKARHKVGLIGMFVHESCRGLGAGRALVEAALAHASSVPHARSVVLTVTEGNAAAIRLYESCGFTEFGVEPMAVLTPSGYQAKVHMWCRLASAG